MFVSRFLSRDLCDLVCPIQTTAQSPEASWEACLQSDIFFCTEERSISIGFVLNVSGVEWMEGCIPVEHYMLKFFPTLDEFLDPELLEWQKVEDTEDGEVLLKWIYEYYILRTADSSINQHEALRFVVLDHDIFEDPWFCELHIWEVNSQMQWTVWFKLANSQ